MDTTQAATATATEGDHVNWRKPAGCSLNDVCIEVAPCDTGQCIEVSTDVPGLRPGDIAIRNSQRPGTVVVADRAEFAAFVKACAAGAYDDLCATEPDG